MLREKILDNKKIVLILISVLSVLPLFFGKEINMSDDISFHISRIYGVFDNLSIGKIIPVYYKCLHGFGYGNGLFYPDLFLYIPAFFMKCGLNIILSYKVFVFLINFCSLGSMYLCVYRITRSKNKGFFALFLYAFSFYRVQCFFQRGALGESLSFIFIPFVILGLYEIFFGNEKKGYYISFGLFGLMSSHVITTYIVIFIILLYIALNYKCLKNFNRLKSLIIYIVFSMLSTMYFWLPLIEQVLSQKFNFNSNVLIFDNIVPVYILLIDFPIYNLYRDIWLPPGVGIIYYFFFIKLKNTSSFIKSLCIISFVLLCFIIVSFIWKIDFIYKLFSIIQFPWRLYTPLTCLFIIIFSVMCKKNLFFRVTIIYVLIMFLFNCFIISFRINLYNGDFDRNTIMFGEYLPIEVVDDFAFDDYKNKNIEYSFDKNVMNVIVKKGKEIELPLIYYKGYKAYSDDSQFKIYKTSKGLVGVSINDDIVSFKVFYDGTFIYKISRYISILSIIIFFLYLKRGVKVEKVF